MTHREILLRQVPLFQSLPEGERRRLAALLVKRPLKKGDFLFRQGDEGDCLYMIVCGKIKIVRQSREGNEVILAILGRGDFCGEMALLDGLPRSADAVAVEETQLYGLNRKEFLSYVLNNEPAVRAILAAISRRLRKADDFIEDIFSLDISDRLVKKLIELAIPGDPGKAPHEPVKLSVTQKDLAGMVGASRESVNKELRLLRESGLIQVSGRTLLIPDVDALRLRVR